MFINFDEREIESGFGFKIQDEYPDLYNQWSPFPESRGADVRCQLVHLGKRVEGNRERLRIAVYETAYPMETLILLPLEQVNMALSILDAMASKIEIVAVR